MKSTSLAAAAGLCLLFYIFAMADDKGASMKAPGELVDHGSFGIFVDGRRMATETFSVHQQNGGVNTISSRLKEESSPDPSQEFELQMTADGTLVRYHWQELSPGKSELEVVPNKEFLIERVTPKPGDKPAEHPFLMPATSLILDNNFFVQREVLAWRYLASSCVTEKGQFKCAQAQFGVVVPQEQISSRVTVQPVGAEKVTIRGTEQTLLHLALKTDDGEWGLWVDPQNRYKLIRVTKTGENSEILRD